MGCVDSAQENGSCSHQGYAYFPDNASKKWNAAEAAKAGGIHVSVDQFEGLNRPIGPAYPVIQLPNSTTKPPQQTPGDE
jgi:hypothetical protein